MKIEIVPVDRDLLGEAPIWDVRAQALYWVDQIAPKLRRYAPETGEYREWLLPDLVGGIALSMHGSPVLTLADGFYHFDVDSGDCQRIATVSHAGPGVRMNDGRCDRSGRLIAGSVVTDGSGAHAFIYRLDPDGSVEVLQHGLTIANGVCFTESGDRMYFTDSRSGQMMVCDYDSNGTYVGPARVFADIRPFKSVPDGATVDAEGGVWIALIQNGLVLRFLADGTFDFSIQMPVPHASSISFGGPNLDVLYVTTVRETRMLIKSDHPQAGALLAITGLGVRGVAEGRFGIVDEARRTLA